MLPARFFAQFWILLFIVYGHRQFKILFEDVEAIFIKFITPKIFVVQLVLVVLTWSNHRTILFWLNERKRVFQQIFPKNVVHLAEILITYEATAINTGKLTPLKLTYEYHFKWLFCNEQIVQDFGHISARRWKWNIWTKSIHVTPLRIQNLL